MPTAMAKARKPADPIRSLVAQRIKDKDLDMSAISLDLGKNHAYIQQFLNRGVPAKLPETIRPRFAEMLDVDETSLGAPVGRKPLIAANLPPTVKEIDVRGTASPGGGVDGEVHWEEGGYAAEYAVARWGLPSTYVRNELGLDFERSAIISVRGDSMDDGTKFGLSSGDRVIVDHQDTDPRQGGIFAVWDGGGVIIKQVELLRDAAPLRIVCRSLNARYAPIELVVDDNVRVIGRIAAKIARM